MAKDDMGMEKGVQMQQAPMTGKGENDPLLPNLNMQPVEGGPVVAGKMKPVLNKWRLPYWLLVVSVIVMTNNIHAAPKYKMIIPPEVEAAAMILFLCAICFIIFATMSS